MRLVRSPPARSRSPSAVSPTRRSRPTAARSDPCACLHLPGSVVAARLPVAVGAGNVEVSQRIADVCLGALALAVPDRVGAASQGTMNNVLVGGSSFVYYETIGGGQGGRPGPRPGMNGVHTAMTNTLDTPVEALERAFPMRVRRYALRSGSRWRRRRARRRGHRTRVGDARGGHGVAHHGTARRHDRGVSPAATPARAGRTGCSGPATSRVPNRSPTSAPSTSRPVTSCASARPVAAAGAGHDFGARYEVMRPK